VQHTLSEYLKQYDKLAIALSGSASSALLLREAAAAIGPDHVLAITANTEFLPKDQFSLAGRIAKLAGVAHAVVPVYLLDEPRIQENGSDRCYYCKRAIFRAMLQEAWLRGYDVLAEASCVDDISRSSEEISALFEELGVVRPFIASNMDRNSISALGYETVSDTKAYRCLADQAPPGTPITEEYLQYIENTTQSI